MANEPVPGVNPPAPPTGAPEGQTIPYARFKEVNDELKAYKDLGFSRDELEEALVALATLVQQAQATPQAGARGSATQSPNTSAGGNGQFTQGQWEEWLFNTFPWFREMKGAYESQQQEATGRNSWRVEQSQTRLKKLAKDAGYSEDQSQALENIISSLIRGDERMLAAWRNGDLSVVDSAFNSHRTGFVEPMARKFATEVSGRKAVNRQQLAPKVAGGAAPAPDQPPKPKTVAEAHDAAMAKLEETGSELPAGEEEIVQE